MTQQDSESLPQPLPEAKEWPRGCVQVYTGEGKGKTTAAIGMAVRAAGRGMHTFIGQFMKGRNYGELHALRRFPEITLEQFGDPGWVYRDKLKPHQIEQARAGLARGRAVLAAGQHQIVVLDEINMAIWFGLIALEDVLDLIDHKPPQIELVLTGRRAHEAVIARADLVTEMREIKHTYQVNIPARYGIEH